MLRCYDGVKNSERLSLIGRVFIGRKLIILISSLPDQHAAPKRNAVTPAASPSFSPPHGKQEAARKCVLSGDNGFPAV